jgi:ABC-2 type transport system permease protein
MRGAAFLALVFGAFVAIKSAGYATAYSTVQARAAMSALFGNNIGLSALLGRPHDIETVTGFAVWNTLSGMIIIGSIWAFLLATRNFRGEEDAGRWELMLASQTTARKAAVNVLAGLGTSLLLLYVVTAATFTLVGRLHSVGFSTGSALFFALAAVAAAAMFMAVGALASQLMPTRSRAASLSAGVFGVCFLVRAMADSTSAHWLLNITPLGWIEQLQPLNQSHPIWLLPIGALIVLLAAATIFLAGRRDLGASIIADKDSAPAHTLLLRSPLTAALRLTRAASLSWLFAVTAVGIFFGLLTKSAAGAFSDSQTAAHIIGRLVQASQRVGAEAFLSILFLILMTLIMVCVANSVGAMREDEADGYLDNLLVRPVSRWQWLTGRVALTVGVIVLAGLLAGVGAWIGASSQQAGVPFHTLLQAGVNTMAPALLVLGIGICSLGLVPRLTGLISYGIIAWSFLIELVSSGLNLNHWVLDTSILHHMALAPAADPKWGTDAIMVGLGLLLCLIGAAAFSSRDLEAE